MTSREKSGLRGMLVGKPAVGHAGKKADAPYPGVVGTHAGKDRGPRGAAEREVDHRLREVDAAARGGSKVRRTCVRRSPRQAEGVGALPVPSGHNALPTEQPACAATTLLQANI